MEIEEKKFDHVVILKPLSRRIDVTNSVALKARVVDVVTHGQWNIILDLSQVEFIDSSGLGSLVSSFKTIVSNQGTLGICCANTAVMSLFSLTRMDRVFHLYKTEEEAVRAATQVR